MNLRRVTNTKSTSDENSYLLADFHNIFIRWKNYFSQLLNEHRVNDVKQMEIYSAEPLVPGPSPFRLKLLLQHLKSINWPILIKKAVP
jgi:hypothetical protein